MGVSRTPTYLAALASGAVPGLDPVAVRAARGRPGDAYDLAFVTDTQRRAWAVRAPRSAAAGAELDIVVTLLGLLIRRVPFGVPVPRGFAAIAEGRAVVYPYLHGRSVVLEAVDPGPGVAAEIGRTLAALHNVDRAVFDEAGVPAYDAESWRTRRLADLDRAAATGHVPTALLSRWERALEDVSAWRFAPTPVHGDLVGDRMLVSFSDESDPTTASMRGVTGWDQARIGDPADDLAPVLDRCREETVDSVLESYALARIERPDTHLRRRARLAGELRHLSRLLTAVSAGDPALISAGASSLRSLDERTAGGPSLDAPEPALPVRPRPAPASPSAAGPSAATRLPSAATDGAENSAGGEGSERSAAQESAVQQSAVQEEDTQLLQTGRDAEATRVIPDEELVRLRAAEAVADDDEFGDLDAAGDDVTDETVPGEEGADATVPGEEGADATVPGEEGADATVPGEELVAHDNPVAHDPVTHDNPIPGENGPNEDEPAH